MIGGLFQKKNISGIRLGGGGSVSKGATIEVDLESFTGRFTPANTQYDTRAIIIELGPKDKSGRVRIEHCDLRMVNADRS